MIRRRRLSREIPFSFDSFLDIVANVVGIIIRLILVVWVGARSYSSVQTASQPSAPTEASSVGLAAISDSLQDELTQHRQELAAAQERLLAQLRRLEQWQQAEGRTEKEWASVSAHSQELDSQRHKLQKAAADQEQAMQSIAITSAELRQRSQKLAEEIRDLEKMPIPQRVLRYRTPISRPVQSEELLFECKHGRVTFIDIAALLAEVHEAMEDQAKALQNQWEVHGVTGAQGAFRLRYALERERGPVDALAPNAPPPSSGGFRAGLSEWQIEPVAPNRGEPVSAALAPSSEFRQIVDGIDPRQTAVTFWVYPDSFALYRRLRDYLYERDVTVAGRPLPDYVLIASSRRGTVSRGQ
jgi:hypothetical protein